MTEPVEPAVTAQNRLPLLIGAGVGTVALILVLTQVLGGDDDPDDAAPPVTPPPGATTPVPVTPTSLPPSGGPAETFEVFSTKNPFVPLRSSVTGGSGAGGPTTGGSAATGGAATTGTGGTTTGGATTAGTGGTTTGGTAAPGTGGTATGTGGTEPRRGARVALLDVFTEGGETVANVRVNDTVHKVSEGEVFATSFKVVSLSQADRCGRFVFGDDSFRLCRNEETLK